MLTTFKTQDAFLSALSVQLDSADGSKDQRSALLAGLVKADDALRTEPNARDKAALNLKVGAWVIRDADLPLLAALSATGTAIATTLGTAGIAWPLIATSLTALAEACWKAWRKGAHLSAPQVQVYGLLQSRGPIKEDELSKLVALRPDAMGPFDFRAVLASLTELELNDGNIIRLAQRDDGGFWRAHRI